MIFTKGWITNKNVLKIKLKDDPSSFINLEFC